MNLVQQNILRQVRIINARIYSTKLALDGASADFVSFESRLASFEHALSFWKVGSFEHDRILRSYPELATALNQRTLT